MCSPALALGLIGGVIQGIGAAQQAQNAAANAEAQRQAALRDAAIKQEQGSYEGARAKERGGQLVGKQVATYSAGGINPSTGSPVQTIATTAADVQLDIAAARWGTQRSVENSIYESKVAEMNKKSAQQAAPIAFLTPIISSFGTFLQGSYA